MYGEATPLRSLTRPRISNLYKVIRTCGNRPSKDKDSKSVNLKEQATKIEQVIENNKHKIEPTASDISDEECMYDYMYVRLFSN